MQIRSSALAEGRARARPRLAGSRTLPPADRSYRDLVAETAALRENLAQNHPFVAGNERAGFAVTYTLLVINVASVTANAGPTYAVTNGSYDAGAFDFEHLGRWLRENVSRRHASDP